MEEKQFSLDGVLFGLATDIGMLDTGWQPGAPAIRANHADTPGASGRRFGREFAGQTVWGFSLYTNVGTEEEAWERVATLRGAWRSLADQADVVDSETVVPLFYRIAGQDRVVYGRPQAFDIAVDNTSLSGRIGIEANFELSYPIYFDADEQSFSMSILPPLNVEVGVIAPMIVPFTSSSTLSERRTSITVGGDRTTPIVIELRAGTGPLWDARIEVNGNPIQLTDPVYPTDPVIIDPRPWARSIATKSGGAVGVDARVSRLSKLWLPPGDHEVVLTGTDPTSSATTVISWNNARRAER